MTELYHDQSRNLLVYRTDQPEQITRYVKTARQVNGHHVAVPISLYNLQLLRWLNYPVVPAMVDYDWPHGPDIPHPYETQKLASNFAVLHPKSFNLSDLGSGKTLSALWAADYVMQQSTMQCRCLIVAPLTVLQRVWGDAVFKHFMNRRDYVILHGSPKRRRKLLAEPHDFYIINHDGLAVGTHHRRGKLDIDGLTKDLLERTDIRIAIVDEASVYRDHTTLRHRIAMMVLKRDYLWMLTGTPTPNAPADAYGLAKLVNPPRESFSHFKSRTMIKLTQFKWVAGAEGYNEARKLLSPAIRFDIKDVWDGPEMTTQQHEVELTAEQTKMLAALKRNLQVEAKNGTLISAVNEASARTKFLQIVLGAIYDRDHKAHKIDSSPRLKTCEEIIESTTRKILIFVTLTSVVDLLYKHLAKRWGCGVINGAVSPPARAALIQRFVQDPDFRVMIADPQSTAHGINEFVAADTVIWYGPTDKTELYLQGIKRVHRPGQKHPTTCVQLAATKLEREIFRRLERNETLQGALLDMIRKGDEL